VTIAQPQATGDAASENGGSALSDYSQEERPLGSYAVLSGTFGTGLVAALVAFRRSGRLPERIEYRDIALIGVATHKLSRMIAKDKVTSVLRAPFTRYQEPSGKGELEEKARGEGMQRAFGELVSCPYCLSQWIATAFAFGLVASPRTTRFLAAIYTAETISDFLQAGYLAAEKRA
jgi:hypothetical protein